MTTETKAPQNGKQQPNKKPGRQQDGRDSRGTSVSIEVYGQMTSQIVRLVKQVGRIESSMNNKLRSVSPSVSKSGADDMIALQTAINAFSEQLAKIEAASNCSIRVAQPKAAKAPAKASGKENTPSASTATPEAKPAVKEAAKATKGATTKAATSSPPMNPLTRPFGRDLAVLRTRAIRPADGSAA